MELLLNKFANDAELVGAVDILDGQGSWTQVTRQAGGMDLCKPHEIQDRCKVLHLRKNNPQFGEEQLY